MKKILGKSSSITERTRFNRRQFVRRKDIPNWLATTEINFAVSGPRIKREQGILTRCLIDAHPLQWTKRGRILMMMISMPPLRNISATGG